ncbi:MAG: 5'/3'-nucleotidase SurE [Bacteroidaceae bacterium]|nr:5'/3'-nucleotidase SurE [Bacteroidaceae bacterium]
MNIVIVNDDGYDSPLTHLLRKFLIGKGHKVYCFLPDDDCSAYSLHFCKYENAKIREVKENIYVVSASPVICLHTAVTLLNIPIDLLISGINKGLNYGSTILYSATVAAALEAKLYGLNSIAISIDTKIREFDSILFLLDNIFVYMNKHQLLTHALNVNIFKMNSHEKVRIIYENEVVDFNYILPKVELSYDNHGVSSCHIQYNNARGNIYTDNCLMLGVISRNEGFSYDKRCRNWLIGLRKYISIN